MTHRSLVVMADDYGICPATSAGILDLAKQGLITGSALLVNTPFAEQAVQAWLKAGSPMPLGWHVNLTLDGPCLDPHQVSSLVGPDGKFWPLGKLVKRLLLGRIAPEEIEAELKAQHRRFIQLLGHPPAIVNAHHHINLFHPVGYILLDILNRQKNRPYVRRVSEPWTTLIHVPGARAKRTFLAWLGRSQAKIQKKLGFPGNDWLAGIAHPQNTQDPLFFVRWLHQVPGEAVELMCHPGHRDADLVGREGRSALDPLIQRRVDELFLLEQPSFREAVADAGFHLLGPDEFLTQGKSRKDAA